MSLMTGLGGIIRRTGTGIDTGTGAGADLSRLMAMSFVGVDVASTELDSRSLVAPLASFVDTVGASVVGVTGDDWPVSVAVDVVVTSSDLALASTSSSMF